MFWSAKVCKGVWEHSLPKAAGPRRGVDIICALCPLNHQSKLLAPIQTLKRAKLEGIQHVCKYLSALQGAGIDGVCILVRFPALWLSAPAPHCPPALFFFFNF